MNFDILLSGGLLSGSIDTSVLDFSTTHLFWALILGGLSAISLPLGSALGLMWKPKPRVTAAFTAFGGGALFAALAIELVAPTTSALADGHGDSHHAIDNMVNLVLGMVLGGVLFFVLDQIVNAKGGFLRKTATTLIYMSIRKQQKEALLLEQLGKIHVLRKVPSEHVQALVNMVRPRTFEDGEVLFEEGDRGDHLYFIVEGSISLSHPQESSFKELHAGDVLGEIALLTGAPRTAKAVAHGRVKTLALHKQDFDGLRLKVPQLDEAARQLAEVRLQELGERKENEAQEKVQWIQKARGALQQGVSMPTEGELKKAKEEHSGAPLAIWLGILLDGVPESFVIGVGFLGLLAGKALAAPAALESLTLMNVIPYTLIAGLFLSNFPEAMSSSIGMRSQGWGRLKILVMWSTLMVMTSIGAGVGYLVGGSAPESIVISVEGLAAGAMFAMIISAMLPEAIHLGGSYIAGMSSLAGFLAAIAFKLLE